MGPRETTLAFDRTPFAFMAVLAALAAGCGMVAPTPEPNVIPPAEVEPAILLPTAGTAGEGYATPTPGPETTKATVGESSWQGMPVIPEVSEGVRDVYRRGLEMGNDPSAFSKVGDCGSSPSWFLGVFDSGPTFYRLGDHESLGDVIRHFEGSYGRISLAARSGFNASSVFSPLWSDPELCEAGEGPLECEYRVHRPSFAFIMLGTNDRWHQDEFGARLREIVAFSIERGVVPIVGTKPDNLEGDGSLNATIVRVAQDYDIPLWNEWRAMQPLPNGGLQEDGAHLTWEPNWFDSEVVMRSGWPTRNLTALQALDAVWRAVTERPPSPP